ncbi:purple acid phosphatase 3-like [Actinidia eriantha]|uniref:purple acid phosphatase 3-like n=1 Tax=Actinidia eriantha TaxID=165200 RepID=UPI00258A8AC5|nr:purple acid phosphatase 3-like [Actinidia eriantha]
MAGSFKTCVFMMMLSLCWGGLSLQTIVSEIKRRQKPNNVLTFLVVGDWGRGGTFNQSMVASQMGVIGEKLRIDFVVSTGDNFYNNGLNSTKDSRFVESFTEVYTAKSLQKQWYSVLGNHDYRGDVLAQLSPNLRKIDKRWLCVRNYALKSGFADLFFIDTNPFVNKYFEQPKNHNYDWRGVLPREKYVSNLIKNLGMELKKSSGKWKIVIGHHTIRSVGHHGDTQELVQQLLPILQENSVNMYINGHDHCLEHMIDTKSSIQFLTSGGGSKAWKGDIHDKPLHDNLKFYYDGQGFMSVRLTKLNAQIAFYDVLGNVRHHLT